MRNAFNNLKVMKINDLEYLVLFSTMRNDLPNCEFKIQNLYKYFYIRFTLYIAIYARINFKNQNDLFKINSGWKMQIGCAK